MFLAGLELDLDEFQANWRAALTFGAFTFTIPFALAALLLLPFGYGLATALLFGSLWASHTLVAYPIVQERGLLRNSAVGVAGGGTVMTDTLALSVLAVVAGSVESEARPTVLLIEVALGLVLLAAFCGLVLPRVTRWVFAGVGQHRGALPVRPRCAHVGGARCGSNGNRGHRRRLLRRPGPKPARPRP
jgi:Kef-type K+ transport system membrane component KefB